MEPRRLQSGMASAERASQTSGELLPALPEDIQELAVCLMGCLCEAGLRVATAESCTGGLLSAILTGVEGASHAFDRGYVVYTDEAKQELLGVPPDLIEAHGAVSADVAAAMAQGALAASRADLALAITGFAGPATSDDEEGLVHYACLRRGAGRLAEQQHFGSLGRSAIRMESIRTGLCMLIKAATGEWPAGQARGDHPTGSVSSFRPNSRTPC